MEVIYILIVMLALFVAGLVTLVVFEYNKRDQRKTRAYFIYKDNSFKVKKYKQIKDSINYDGGVYNYDRDAVIKKGNTNYIFYRVGKPAPLQIDAAGKFKFTSFNINTLVETSVLERLFGGVNADMKQIKIMQIIMIAGIIAVVAFFILGSQKGVSIATPENKEFITEAVRSALR